MSDIKLSRDLYLSCTPWGVRKYPSGVCRVVNSFGKPIVDRNGYHHNFSDALLMARAPETYDCLALTRGWIAAMKNYIVDRFDPVVGNTEDYKEILRQIDHHLNEIDGCIRLASLEAEDFPTTEA